MKEIEQRVTSFSGTWQMSQNIANVCTVELEITQAKHCFQTEHITVVNANDGKYCHILMNGKLHIT